MRVNDKGVSCSKPLACAQTAVKTDARQVRVTHIETRQLEPTSTPVGPLALALMATDVAVMFPSRSDVFHLSISSGVMLVLFTVCFSHRQFLVFIHD